MKCEHEIDIDEYDCFECQAFMRKEAELRQKIRDEIKELLNKNGYWAELKMCGRI